MVNSVSNRAAQTQWQTVQAARTAQPAAPVSPVSPASSVGADAAAPVKARYDSVQISAEGRAYAGAQTTPSAPSTQTGPSAQTGPGVSDNAALFKQLNTADSSGTSYLQRQIASLRAGVSAAALLGNSGAGASNKSSFSQASPLDMNALLSSYTQSRQSNVILRNAGASALGIQPPQSGSPSDSTESAEGAGGAEEGVSSDLSKYSLGELSKLLSSGEITTEQYLAEGANRQKQQTGAVSAAVGAAVLA